MFGLWFSYVLAMLWGSLFFVMAAHPTFLLLGPWDRFGVPGRHYGPEAAKGPKSEQIDPPHPKNGGQKGPVLSHKSPKKR